MKELNGNRHVYLDFQLLCPQVMPISMEQWRASVGRNNAARTNVLAKNTEKKISKHLLGQFMLFLLTLFCQGVGLVTSKGKTETAIELLGRTK